MAPPPSSQSDAPRRSGLRDGVALALVVATLALTSWPLAGLLTPGLIGASDQEATEHLWALHTAAAGGAPLLSTTMVGFPVGYRWVLADPLSLVPYWLGAALARPETGLLLVHLMWLGVAAAAAASWAGRLQVSRLPAALLALVVAPLCSPMVTGITDAAGLGLTMLALLGAHRLQEESTTAEVAAVGALAGATIWAGPYPALYLAVLAPLLVAFAARRVPWRVWMRAAAVAAVVAAPMVILTVWQRDAGLPGSTSVLPAIQADPGAPPNLLLGLEPWQLLWGTAGTSPAHGGYLGVPLLLLAAAGTARLPRRSWLLVATAALASVLSLGFHLVHDGTLVTVGGRIIALPARGLTELLPGLGRAPRWYRMAGVAALALVPLAVRGAQRLARGNQVGAAVLVAVVMADHLGRSPLPWPRPSTATPRPALASLPSPGAVGLLPRPDATDSRGQRLYAQVVHRHPLVANPHAQTPARNPADDALRTLEAAAARHDLQAVRATRQRLWALGLTWIAVEDHLVDAAVITGLTDALGPPAHRAGGLQAWYANR